MLDGKAAIVTGSGRGIGRAAAELLAEQGASVLVNDIDRDLAEQAAAEIGGGAVAFAGDLTEPEAPAQLIATAVEAFGRLDVVVNNAGYTLDAPVHKMSDEAFQAMLDIHTVVPFRVLRAAAPHLREPAKAERERGEEVFRKVVNVSSVSGTFGGAGQANYSSAKAGVIGLTKALAKEWGPLKINVNAVAYGFVDTRLTVAKNEDTTVQIGDRTARIGVPAARREAVESLIPLGRAASPREAAGGILTLCLPFADYVHGQVLYVNGGLTSGMGS
jgi:3-oxoacyl-[acyl-carrier protein] reductase